MLESIMNRFPSFRSTAAIRSRRPWLRLALALAIMLGAVLPHATFAATLHLGAATAYAPHAIAAVDPGTPPCHGAGRPAHHDLRSAPACCVLGCGLLAGPAETPAIVLATIWAPARANSDAPVRDTPPEPAERPPR